MIEATGEVGMEVQKAIIWLLLLVGLSGNCLAEIIDPENYIRERGYDTKGVGDDGKTVIYSKNQPVSVREMYATQADIKALAKNQDVFKACDFMRGGIKARLIESLKTEIDVAVINYGWEGKTIACQFKYMHADKVGNQLVYVKKGTSALYMLFVVDGE